jgi:hypothetical protein
LSIGGSAAPTWGIVGASSAATSIGVHTRTPADPITAKLSASGAHLVYGLSGKPQQHGQSLSSQEGGLKALEPSRLQSRRKQLLVVLLRGVDNTAWRLARHRLELTPVSATFWRKTSASEGSVAIQAASNGLNLTSTTGLRSIASITLRRSGCGRTTPFAHLRA